MLLWLLSRGLIACVAPQDDPRPWWIAMLKAIVGLQRGSTSDAWAYHEFVKAQRGEAAAERCRAEVKRYAKSPRFDSAEKLLAKAEGRERA